MDFPNKEKLFEFSIRNTDRKFEHDFVLFDAINNLQKENFGNHYYIIVTNLYNGSYSRTLDHLIRNTEQGKEAFNVNLITLSSFGNKMLSDIQLSFLNRPNPIIVLTHGLNTSKFKLDHATKIKGTIQPMEEIILAFYK